MSDYAPPPSKPDSRIFASYPMPAKIDLINERPRRESLIEQQLEDKINVVGLPQVEVTHHRIQGQQHDSLISKAPQMSYTIHDQVSSKTDSLDQQNQMVANKLQEQQATLTNSQFSPNDRSNSATTKVTTTTTTIQTNTSNALFNKSDNAARLAAELADKEAKLMAEITALHQRPYSPFQVPPKIDLGGQQLQQQQYQQQQMPINTPSPRPYSRASSTRSTAQEDLLAKEAKLMQEIEEMERKPFNPQTMVVEREQWYEYPEGRPNQKQLTDSKRRVKDFCSMPSHMYSAEGAHIHEEDLPASLIGRPSSSAASSVHTTIIRSPRREVDNKSPLPFAFDNFTTKGVRGNIASVGAVEPERPPPPIYPILKRNII